MERLYVTCAHCHMRNRLPPERLGDAPRCGACKRPVFSAHPIAIDAVATFDHHLQGSDLPLVVDFWAGWCGPCRALAPAFEAAAERLEPRLRLLKVNVDEVPDLATRYGIRSVPTLVSFRAGREQGRQSGALPPPQLVAWLEQWGT